MRKGSRKQTSWREQIEQHQPASRQQCAHHQQEKEHLVPRLARRAGNERWKGQMVQTEQEQRSRER